MNRSKAIISVIILVIIFIFLLYTTPRQEWGDISQSLIYHQVRKMLLKLDLDKNHPKYWRPSVLLYAPTPDTYPLIDFCNVLKKGGLYVVGTVYQNSLKANYDEFYTLENFWSFFIGHVFCLCLSFLVQCKGILDGEFCFFCCGRTTQHGVHLRIGRIASEHDCDSSGTRARERGEFFCGYLAPSERDAGHRTALRFCGMQ